MNDALYKIIDKNGDVDELKSYVNLKKTWDIIVPGYFQIGGGGNTDLFFYDGGQGIGVFYNTDAQGNLTGWGGEQSLNKSWDMIIPLTLGANSQTNLLFYSKKDGNAGIFRPDANGKLVKVREHSFSPKWDIIVSGKFGGGTINDDLLFYDRGSGEAKFFSVNHYGELELMSNVYWRKTWHTIISGHFDASAGNSSLFFYDNVTGEGKFFRAEDTKLHLLGKFNMQKDWDIIVPRDVHASNFLSGLLFYDRESGKCAIFSVSTVNSFNIQLLKEHSLPKMKGAIIPFPRPHQLNYFLIYGNVNKAVYLDWGSYIDTQLEFSTFFDNDHAVMCWFMPQYPHCYEGPIIAENGTGTYMIYQGNYIDDGNSWKDSDDTRHEGNYVLCVYVGNNKKKYIIREFQKYVWLHIALVRKNNKFSLYINGKYREPVIINSNPNAAPTETPDTDITVTVGLANKPSGKLRFGKRTSGASGSYRNWQGYGLLDDVAVFNRALEESEIANIMHQRRLTGAEQGIIAGWSFDTIVPSNSPNYNKPPNSVWTSSNRVVNSIPISLARSTIVTLGKQNSADLRKFVDPTLVAKNQGDLILPFKHNENWRVNQGNDDPVVSHFDTANFSYDLGRKPDPANAEIRAACPGKLLEYLINAGLSSKGQEKNIIRILRSPGQIVSYRHIADNSTPSEISGGTLDPDTDLYVVPDNSAPTIEEDKKIGEVGTAAKHLHITLWNAQAGEGGVGIPVAFKNYEVSENEGKSWSFVIRGHPKYGQWIRRYFGIPGGQDGP